MYTAYRQNQRLFVAGHVMEPEGGGRGHCHAPCSLTGVCVGGRGAQVVNRCGPSTLLQPRLLSHGLHCNLSLIRFVRVFRACAIEGESGPRARKAVGVVGGKGEESATQAQYMCRLVLPGARAGLGLQEENLATGVCLGGGAGNPFAACGSTREQHVEPCSTRMGDAQAADRPTATR